MPLRILKVERRPLGVEKFSRPGRQLAMGIAILRRDELQQVREFLVVIAERIEIGGIVGGQRILFRRIVLDGDGRRERQGVGALVEGRDRYGVAEHVVDPAQPTSACGSISRWLAQYPQIMAVARAQHDAVLAERDRAGVAINGLVVDGQERHRQIIINSGTSNLGQILLNCRSGCRFDRHRFKENALDDAADTTLLLSSEDVPPVREFNAGGRSPFLLTCDHYGRLIPRGLGDLGLPESELDAPYRLGHRHCRRRGGALKTSRRPSDRAALLAARHRLQPPARCRKLDPAHQRGHDDIRQ